jgi:S-adenosylhomocysteine hydrolase
LIPAPIPAAGRNAKKYENKVYVLPKTLDEKVARPHLD